MTVPVSVIIISYNTKTYTRNALTALFASNVNPAQVIVVDNASTDGSDDMVEKEFSNVQLIRSKENIGFAKANNIVIKKYVNQPYVWLLNSDTETGEKTLQELYEYLEAHPHVAAVGPQLVYPDGTLQSVGGGFPRFWNVFLYLFPVLWLVPLRFRRSLNTIAWLPQPLLREGKKIDYATGASLMLRKSALDNVGLLGEQYFMYFEETDLCFRLWRSGKEVHVVDTEPVMHVYGGSFKRKHAPDRLKYFLDSLVIFVQTYYRGFSKWSILCLVRLGGSFSIRVKSLRK